MLDRLTIERIAKAAGESPILIALSGGGDSVALLHLMTKYFGAARLRAAVVDHKLRKGSESDARKAADIARALAVQANLLELTWLEASNRAHEAARELRYAALCQHARTIGARVIAAGHTRDDQAETVLIRAGRGSGLRGLAGMRAFAPVPIWPEGRGLWLARPLLGARRAELRAYLKAHNTEWIEDPANENQMHARVRARRTLAELDRDGLDPMRFAALAERLLPLVAAIDAEAAALIDTAVAFDEDKALIDCALWRGAEAVKRRTLEALIIAASGEERGPPPAQLERLHATLDQPDFSGATLGGALLEPGGTRVAIRRDPGALKGRAGGAAPAAPLPLPPGEETVWDGRVALTLDEPGWSVVFDGRKPVLQHGEKRRPLAAASPHWLLRERLQHVLGTD
jgi:tRNA(Ile)-lysidine synthase